MLALRSADGWLRTIGDKYTGESTGEHDPWKTSIDDVGDTTPKGSSGTGGSSDGGLTSADAARLGGALIEAGSRLGAAAIGASAGGGSNTSGTDGYGRDGVMPRRSQSGQTSGTSTSSSGSGTIVLGGLALLAAVLSGALK